MERRREPLIMQCGVVALLFFLLPPTSSAAPLTVKGIGTHAVYVEGIGTLTVPYDVEPLVAVLQFARMASRQGIEDIEDTAVLTRILDFFCTKRACTRDLPQTVMVPNTPLVVEPLVVEPWDEPADRLEAHALALLLSPDTPAPVEGDLAVIFEQLCKQTPCIRRGFRVPQPSVTINVEHFDVVESVTVGVWQEPAEVVEAFARSVADSGKTIGFEFMKQMMNVFCERRTTCQRLELVTPTTTELTRRFECNPLEWARAEALVKMGATREDASGSNSAFIWRSNGGCVVAVPLRLHWFDAMSGHIPTATVAALNVLGTDNFLGLVPPQHLTPDGHATLLDVVYDAYDLPSRTHSSYSNGFAIRRQRLLRVTALNAVVAARFIVQRYEKEVARKSCIHEHLPTLRFYAEKVDTVVEMGVRGVVSTWAFLSGLAIGRNDSGVRSLIGVDSEACEYGQPMHLGPAVGIDVRFVKGDSAKVTVPPRDLLFIDTWHVYGHLKRELSAHHATTFRYIILHDTTVDAEGGEALRSKQDVGAMMSLSGYPREEIERGLWPAVLEFLADHPEWEIEKRYVNNNGLTVLARKGNGTAYHGKN